MSTQLSSIEVRRRFIEFMKKNDHEIIPNISLVPINDPSLLYVNSGMFPLVNYLMGEKHPQGNRLANIQRCIRTEDIEEVGDNRHHTLFEMIGNWSLNDYFKDEQLPRFMELYVKEFELDVNKIYVSVFRGDDEVERDDESIKLWEKIYNEYGIEAEYTDNPALIGTDTKYRIFGLGRKHNWWKRGDAAGEPGGPTSEMFYDLGIKHNPKFGEHCGVDCDCGKYLEVGNSVFMYFKMNENLEWEEIPQRNIDFGGGFERIVACVQGVVDNYDTDLFMPIISEVEDLSGKKWKDEDIDNFEVREIQNTAFRAIADHIRASVFILADGIVPGNKEQGYILRRLIRRMIRKAKSLGIEENFSRKLAQVVIENYKEVYPHLSSNEKIVLNNIEKEEINFRRTLTRGLKEFQKVTGMGVKFTGEEAFRLFETYGFPLEMIIEELEDQVNDKGDFSEVERQNLVTEFEEAKKKHQEMSRSGADKKFKGGLADQSTAVTRLHTAHHLLLAALQQVLGPHVKQRGSNITAERLRMDFSHTGKLTDEEKKKVEEIVNEVIEKGYVVEKKTMPKAEAEKLGAEMEFGKNYGDLVDVYFVKNPDTGEVFSKEFCGGPHVSNTSEIGESGKFKIAKEESSGAGIRRIKATLS